INTAIRTQTGGYQGISFAIPASIVKQVVGELIQYGRVRRGWLGFLVQEKFIKDGAQTQVEVISVVDGSPASRAGIEVGDIVRRVDGVQIKKISDLVKSIHAKQVGSPIELVIARDGQLLTYNFVLHEKTTAKKGNQWLTALKSRYGITIDDARNGVVIVEVLQFGLAYNVLKKGDIIQSIDGMGIASLQDVIAVLKKNNGVIQNCIVLRGGRAIRCSFNSQEVE
ncbi:MAG TPA: PDZ domain-containing protein, partial [Spirochaetota bacterium]|nr:PDZ domain-containing protein [Spirochaetota bacterium]